jgi:hypothetical protein
VPHAVRIAGTEDFEPGPGSGRTERFTDLIPKLGKVWSQQGSGVGSKAANLPQP